MSPPVWGDPLRCVYRWIEPDRLAEYGDAVHHVANAIGSAMGSLESTASLPEIVFAGAAADSLRVRARARAREAATTCDNLHGVGRALQDHAAALRHYRDALGDLRELATMRGLAVHDEQVWAPTGGPSTDPGQYAEWVVRWRSYQACFELKTDIEGVRREQTRELARALADFAGVRPDPDDAHHDLPGRALSGFDERHDARTAEREARRDAADEARRTLELQAAADDSRAVVRRLRDEHESTLAELHRLSATNASEIELTAQAGKVRLAAAELRSAQLEASRRATELQQVVRQAVEARIS